MWVQNPRLNVKPWRLVILSYVRNRLRLSSEGLSPKGDVREASTIAAIQAVKETSRSLPHCHPIPIEGCTVDWELGEGSSTVPFLSEPIGQPELKWRHFLEYQQAFYVPGIC